MAHSEQLNELAAALVAAQAEFPNIAKTEEGKIKGTTKTGSAYEYSYKYADLATVVETVQPTLAKNGLAISQHLSSDDKGDSLTTWLIHKSGQYINDTMRLHLVKDDPQGQGSATTYARRYSYMAVLGLVADEDDDGQAASKAKPSTQVKPAEKPDAFMRATQHLVEQPEKPVEPRTEPAGTGEHPVHDATITSEQIAELVQLAKRKGYTTKADAINFLNRVSGFSTFTLVLADDFDIFKKAVIQAGWKSSANPETEK